MLTAVTISIFKKTALRIPYPHVEKLSSDFNSLHCEEISSTYMIGWPNGADLVHDSSARIDLSVFSNKEYKASINLALANNTVVFSGDNLWDVDNKPFEVKTNTENRITGAMSITQANRPITDISASFMLDKRTSLLILTDTRAMLSQGESFGTRSRLFSCKKYE